MKRLIAQFILMTAIVAAYTTSATAQNKTKPIDQSAKKDLSLYPKPKAGETQYMTILPTVKNPEDYLVEILPARYDSVDTCNKFLLFGKMIQASVKGYDYYTYKGDGVITGTLMLCPENKLVRKCITGEGIMTPYTAKTPIVAYGNKKVNVQYMIWKGSKKIMADNEKSKPLSPSIKEMIEYTPKEIKGYEKFIIYIPNDKQSQDLSGKKVQIIPSKSAQVDYCNIHSLLGELKEKTVEGYSYPYYIFESDGGIVSTRMGCKDNKTKEELVTNKGEIIDIPIDSPIVVFVPQEIKVQYRIWQAGKLHSMQKVK